MKKSALIRTVLIMVPFALLAGGMIFSWGTGSLSSTSFSVIEEVCPLGALESLLGSHIVSFHKIALLAASLLIVLLIGRSFCAWMCPVPPLQHLIHPKRGDDSSQREPMLPPIENSQQAAGKKGPVEPRHLVLIGALASSAAFGFPVFCLACPIGLTFATFVLVWRLFQYNELTIGLAAFPLILIIELTVFRKWCGKLCPLGALMSLVARANRTFRPVVSKDSCLKISGAAACSACTKACPEQVDLHHAANLPDCTRCGSCSEACPQHAIRFPLFAKRS